MKNEKKEKKEKKPKKKIFDEIWFVGANKEESAKLVEEYQAEAKKYDDEHAKSRGSGRTGRGRGGSGRYRDSGSRNRGGRGARGNYPQYDRQRFDRRVETQGYSRYDDTKRGHYDSRYRDRDSDKRPRYSEGGSGGAKRRRYDDYRGSPVVAPVAYPVQYAAPAYGGQYPPPPTYVYQYASPPAPVQYKSSSYSQQPYYRSSSGQSSNQRRSSTSSRRY